MDPSLRIANNYSRFLRWEHNETWDAGYENSSWKLGDAYVAETDYTTLKFDAQEQCLYCRRNLSVHRSEFANGRHVSECGHCGWWMAMSEWSGGNPHKYSTHNKTIFEGIVQTFDIRANGVPLKVLREHLDRHPDAVFLLNPTSFEELVGDIYRDFFECEVRHVGGPGDNGVDLYAVISDEPHLIQVKRRSVSSKTESVSTVRDFIGTLVTQGVDKGEIVTTAGHFSGPATELVENQFLHRHNIHITLRALNDVRSMLRISNKNLKKPWECI